MVKNYTISDIILADILVVWSYLSSCQLFLMQSEKFCLIIHLSHWIVSPFWRPITIWLRLSSIDNLFFFLQSITENLLRVFFFRVFALVCPLCLPQLNNFLHERSQKVYCSVFLWPYLWTRTGARVWTEKEFLAQRKYCAVMCEEISSLLWISYIGRELSS